MPLGIKRRNELDWRWTPKCYPDHHSRAQSSNKMSMSLCKVMRFCSCVKAYYLPILQLILNSLHCNRFLTLLNWLMLNMINLLLIYGFASLLSWLTNIKFPFLIALPCAISKQIKTLFINARPTHLDCITCITSTVEQLNNGSQLHFIATLLYHSMSVSVFFQRNAANMLAVLVSSICCHI